MTPTRECYQPIMWVARSGYGLCNDHAAALMLPFEKWAYYPTEVHPRLCEYQAAAHGGPS